MKTTLIFLLALISTQIWSADPVVGVPVVTKEEKAKQDYERAKKEMEEGIVRITKSIEIQASALEADAIKAKEDLDKYLQEKGVYEDLDKLKARATVLREKGEEKLADAVQVSAEKINDSIEKAKEFANANSEKVEVLKKDVEKNIKQLKLFSKKSTQKLKEAWNEAKNEVK